MKENNCHLFIYLFILLIKIVKSAAYVAYHVFCIFVQEKHKQELEDMRKAGHEALTIIVEEFKVNELPS